MQTKQNIECEEDRISLLPDCLLIEIISRIPCTKEAIKTGTLSKRWKNLWTEVHNLFFIHHEQNPELFSYIENVLRQRCQSNLNKFALYVAYQNGIGKQVNNWIRYAFSCNVQVLKIGYAEFVLDQFFYINSSITRMKLDRCKFNQTGAISWSNLKSLCIKSGHVSESLIKNILSGSPLLETLKLKQCGGFRMIDITSKSVKNLVFAGYTDEWDEVDIYSTKFYFEIYAPHILSLTIEEGFPAWSDFTLLDVSSLVEATLDYWEKHDYYYEIDDSGILEQKSQDDHGETLKDLILSLCHVKRLEIGGCCGEILARLKAKGFTFPSNMEHPKLPAYVSSESEDSSDNDSTEGEDCSDTDSTKSEDCSDNDSTESED